MVVPLDLEAILPAVQSALDDGIAVIGYDRPIEHEDTLFVGFDTVGLGHQMAQAIYDVVPEGDYAFIKGDPGDPNADRLRAGQQEALLEATGCEALEAPCPIVNVGEAYTEGWRVEVAYENMRQILSDNDNAVDAVVASNDTTANGVIEALVEQGLAGSVAVSGMDGDWDALNRVARGLQTVSIWPDPRLLAQAATDVALALSDGTPMADIDGMIPFETPEGNTLYAILLLGRPVTLDSLDEVLDAGWIPIEVLCEDVEEGTIPSCDD